MKRINKIVIIMAMVFAITLTTNTENARANPVGFIAAIAVAVAILRAGLGPRVNAAEMPDTADVGVIGEQGDNGTVDFPTHYSDVEYTAVDNKAADGS